MSSLKLKHSGGNSMSIEAPATNPASNLALKLPATIGSANQFLKNSGTAGTLGWSSVIEDSSGKVGINTSSPVGKLTVDENNASEHFQLRNTTNTSNFAALGVDSSFNLRVYTNGTNERMRIDSSGTVCIGTTSAHNTGKKLSISDTDHAMEIQLTDSSNVRGITLRHGRASGGTGGDQMVFENSDGSAIGSIQSTGSATSYNTSSDYRLKENVTAISDGITRLKTLKPSRFNFKVDKDTTVDGFLAHEVTAVPEAIKGTKDQVATDEATAYTKGDPIYQSIDQSKLVPLLTAALQEEVAKREALEARVAALEAA